MPHKNIEIKPLSKGSAGMDKDFDVPDPLPKKPFMMTITGERGSGKTCCIQNLIQLYKKSMDYIFIFSPSVFKNDDFEFIKENPIVSSDFSDEESNVYQTIFKFDDIEQFPAKIKNIIKRNSQIILKDGRADAPNILLVLDDILEQGSKLVGRNLALLRA